MRQPKRVCHHGIKLRLCMIKGIYGISQPVVFYLFGCNFITQKRINRWFGNIIHKIARFYGLLFQVFILLIIKGVIISKTYSHTNIIKQKIKFFAPFKILSTIPLKKGLYAPYLTTILTNFFGTTIVLTIVFPAVSSFIFSLESASAFSSSCPRASSASILSLTFPLI